ncbi:hypothetical protein [Kineosporia succinea]|uniref:Uncharacterized protein n=1 Tax=Kineosporia succinea TaxID=84632 RepID=A0ABT9PA25_9ACTN|nr:hypothetical protein [Kineosporia succinea]MDP9829396.1 hypothetical protein [Kineosporia succinea]
MNPDDIRRDLAARAKSKARHDQASAKDGEAMRELVAAGLKAGIGPTELVHLSGWSPAYVRRVARESGIEATGRYKDHAERLKRD